MTERVNKVDVAVIGGGPAGLAAAAAAAREGARVRLIDRNPHLGGILNQCIHDGFGLHAFGEVLTGPEFADRYLQQAVEAGVDLRSHTLVADLTPEGELVCTRAGARETVRAKATVLAMGCRERTRGMIRIPGTRPAGVYTAGTAQWLTNMANIRIGRRVVILGSGDIGLIMARRLTWEGAQVVAVIEKLPYPSGLPRNINQCLLDYGIPLHLSHSVTCIHGKDRLERVTVSRYDEAGCVVPGSAFELTCDTLLLSVGLIPENELSRRAGVVLDRTTSGAEVGDTYMTTVPGIFSCGNVLHIHDLADWAAEEGERAGRAAARYADAGQPEGRRQVAIRAGAGVRYIVPQRVSCDAEHVLLSLRVTAPGGPTAIRAVSGGRALGELRLRKVHPATMEQLEIDASNLADDVEVRCE
jgi:thioredoxin reductase